MSTLFIVSKKRDEMFNLNDATNIFVGNDDSAKIRLGSITAGCLGIYRSNIEVNMAIEMLAERIACNTGSIVYMPTDEEVFARIKNRKEVWHHATGKKTKGHGGS